MNNHERNLVKLVARSGPWLAPLPTGYFVARSSITHLDLPITIGVIVGAIIELLGIASIHTWLWLVDWNINKRKSDPSAPSSFAAMLGVLYLVATIGLTVVLEVIPHLSTYAPAIFPTLSIVGAINLSLIAQQEGRERFVQQDRKERSMRSNETSPIVDKPVHIGDVQVNNIPMSSQHNKLDKHLRIREQAKLDTLNRIVNILNDTPEIGVSELSRHLKRSRTTIYKYLQELESAGHIHRNGNG